MLRADIRPLVYLALLLVCPSLSAQEFKIPDTPEILHIAPPPSDRFPAKWYPRVGDGTDVAIAPVLGKPYTATTESVQPYPSPSGEPLRQVTHAFQARDRFGRTRTESKNGGMIIDGQEAPTKVVIVADPVSHCQFQWTQLMSDPAREPGPHLAFVTCAPQTLRYKDLDLVGTVMDAAVEGTTTHGDTTTTTEHLVPLQIDGITVHRLRVTNTRNNEHAELKHWSGETWWSPDLRELIRMVDAEGGYTGLTDIHQDDPDPKLFYPPDGYTIERAPDR